MSGRVRLFTGILILFVAIDSSARSWDEYRPRTLKSVIDLHASNVAELKEEKALLLTGDNFPSKVTLKYLGKSRPLTGKRKELVEAERKSLRDTLPANLVEMFGTEMLFREGDGEYWIAVQKPLLQYLPKEVRVGDSFTAYVIWLGAIKSAGKWEWVFAMNEFDAPQANDAKQLKQN